MATAAEPRPAELPLSGGSRDAKVKLHPILTATVRGPIGWFLRAEGRMAWRKAFGLGVSKDEWVTAPIQCFLVEHPGAGTILIDTGFHASVAVKPRSNLGTFGTVLYRDIDMRPEQSAAAQLRERGVEHSDVGTVVMTHLHPDHASAIVDYPEATFLVSRREWDAAADGRGQRDGYVRRQFDHGFDYRLIDFDSQAANSFSGFARAFDVFGDGSVRVVFTPGHTLGHMSVVLQTATGEVLVAGDAIFMHRTLDDDHLPHMVADEHLFRRSLREIRQYRKETPDALIIPGHDWDAWQKLDASY
jgi:N-acyl homoserine lactone hydrolase